MRLSARFYAEHTRTMRKSFFLLAILLCATCALTLGCKKGGLAGLVQLTGTVTLNGEPIEGAQLTFAPDDATNGRSALAKTAADGSFTAMTLAPGDGILPGSYKVAVRKMSEPTESAVTSDVNDASHDAEVAANSASKDEVKDLLPIQYASPMTSGITVTVEKGGLSDFKIELK